MTKHYLFEDHDTGEMFIVGADNKGDAFEEAETYFVDPHYIRELSEFEAEASGLDEY